MPSARVDVTLSIVSHGQGSLIASLLSDIHHSVDVGYEIVLTLNVPEDETFLQPYVGVLPLRILRNQRPKGFGGNHNYAFHLALGHHFAVVNPDIRARPMLLQPLVETLSAPQVGACGPVILNAQGAVEDSARRYPTARRLASRVIGRLKAMPQGPDYTWDHQPIDVDWMAGMFILFRREAYAAVGGFDERFFMYFEDADICRRLRRLGWAVKFDPRTSMIHDAQRASHRSMTHMRWHLASALRFLLFTR